MKSKLENFSNDQLITEMWVSYAGNSLFLVSEIEDEVLKRMKNPSTSKKTCRPATVDDINIVKDGVYDWGGNWNGTTSEPRWTQLELMCSNGQAIEIVGCGDYLDIVISSEENNV